MTVTPQQMRTTPPGYFTVRWGLPEYTDWIDESMSWKVAAAPYKKDSRRIDVSKL
jgi:vanillate/3-O-methylgallate O-demethylase